VSDDTLFREAIRIITAGTLAASMEEVEQVLETTERLKKGRKIEGLIRKAQAEGRARCQGRYVPQVARRRLGLPIEPTPKTKRPACGARCRDGHLCRAKVVDGRNRCRLHGGLSCGPKSEAGRAAIAESNRRRAEARNQADNN
jgi:hypothetical protein